MEKQLFGKTPAGRNIYKCRIGNAECAVDILTLGAIIQGFYVKNKKNSWQNIVLSYGKLDEYLDNKAYVGATVGRLAGRTHPAQLAIDGCRYQLATEWQTPHLHGDKFGLNHLVYRIVRHQSDSLTLAVTDPYQNGKPPGDVRLTVTFQIDQPRSLTVCYHAIANQNTYLNITNHSYFNLAMPGCDMTAAQLKIAADSFYLTDQNGLPAQRLPIDRLADFDSYQRISDLLMHPLLKHAKGIDHPFVLTKKGQSDISIRHDMTGLTLEMTSNQPAVVVYSGNYLADITDKFKDKQGICFEFQRVPNYMHSSRERSYLPKASSYIHKTKYIII